MEKHSGSFAVSATTRIVVRAAEDRLAGDAIADEIERATGKRPRVAVGSATPAGTIYLTRLDDRAAASLAAGVPQEQNFKDEGYVLDVESARIVIAAPTAAGAFYGAQTLRQLIRPAANQAFAVPALRIVDWPAMRWRGLHDDISRGPIPTLDTIKQQIRTLAEYKYNLYALYIEHVYDYQAQPIVAPREGALNAAEVKEIVAYAARYYITVLPEQQAFGHLHHLLKYELYQDVAETPHGHVLTPTNPKSYELIKSLYDELVPQFPGPFFHIGSDETFELGQGQTRDRAQQVGLGRVYLEHLLKVYELMKPYKKRLMFWGDIAQRYPELLGILPKDMIAVAWEYDANPDFTSKIKPFKDAGLDVFIAPGSNSWYHLWPNFNVAFVNVRNFVRDGQRLGAIGMLNTTWDDDGETLFGMTWPFVVFGGDCSWQQGECSIERFADAYDWAFYRNSDHTFRDIINALNHTHTLMTGVFAGAAANDQFWLDPFTPNGARFVARSFPVMHDLRLDAEHALESLLRNAAKARLHADTLPYMQLAAMRLDLLGMKVQFAREITNYYGDAYQNQADQARVRRAMSEISSTNGRLQDLRDATERTRVFYEELWLKENRPYWLRNVLVRYDELAGLYQRKIEAVKASFDGYRVSGSLTPPDQLGFFPAPLIPPPPGTLRPGAPGAPPAAGQQPAPGQPPGTTPQPGATTPPATPPPGTPPVAPPQPAPQKPPQ